MLRLLGSLLERFWVWLGGDLPVVETGVPLEPAPGQFVYVVQPGDTLSGIGRRFSTSVWVLADLNDLDDPSLIRVGQPLLIPRPGAPKPAPPSLPSEPIPEPPVETEPGPFIYIVQVGDTLSTIARRFGVTVALIVETNCIQDPNVIWPGQRLLIPGPEPQPEPEPAPPTPEPVPEPPPEPEPIPLPLPEPEPTPAPMPEPVPAPPTEPAPEPELPSKPEPVPTPPVEPLPGQYVYVVQSGDTLLTIARRFNVTFKDIIEANEIEDPNLILPGQQLVIPGITVLPTPTPEPAPAPSPHPPEAPLAPIPWPDDAIRGIYVSYFAMGHEGHRRHIIDILTKTEINALVIDVKGDHGLVSYPTSVPLAHDIGAAKPTAEDLDELIGFFKANGVYTIGRIVTFKDHPFASTHPQWAAQRERGGIWHDREGLAWSDPFVQAAWEYNADLAEESARLGFDEIQFDYVRFPTSSHEGMPLFSQSPNFRTRSATITAFLSYVRSRLASLGVRVAADVFGYACWREDDTLIGQDIGRMAQYLDVLCPMLYPSTFGSGIPGYQNAIAYPYEVVHESMKQAVSRVGSQSCQVRPWIQDFPDYRFDKRVYGPAEIRAQMQGGFDGGGVGYMAWDPRIKYTIEAYFQKTIDM